MNGTRIEIVEEPINPDQRMISLVLPEHIWVEASEAAEKKGIARESVVLGWVMNYLESITYW